MAEDFTLGPVLLLGAPGVGKGTQAKALESRFHVPHISTGDILRQNMSKGTPLGREAKALVDGGQLVPDQVVNDMVKQRLQVGGDIQAGFVLDGYPRTKEQAEFLDTFLSSNLAAVHDRNEPVTPGAESSYHLVAVSIVLEYTQLLRRITGRRTCPTCGTIYNVYFQPAKLDSVCDLDGTALITRKDDTEEVFAERMRAYQAQTAAVVEHYRAKHSLQEVDGNQPPEHVTAQVVEVIRNMRGA